MLTRAIADSILFRRLSSLFLKAGIGSSDSENYLIIGDGLAWGMRMLGYSTASFATATDSDLAGLSSGHADALLDLAELRALENINTRFTSTSVKIGPLQEDLGDFSKVLLDTVKYKRGIVSSMHGSLLAYPLDNTMDETVVLRVV